MKGWFGSLLKLLIPMLLWGMAMSASGCSNRERTRRIDVDHAKTLIDQRNFDEAVRFATRALDDYPGDEELALLLAHAHLGAAGMEILSFTSSVMGEQNFRNVDLTEAPRCDQGRIEDLAGKDFRCILLRVLEHLPAPDNEHVTRSQELFRKYFPDASKAPTDVNFLAAFVELTSALSRLQALVKVANSTRNLAIDPTTFPFEVFIHHAKRGLTEISQGLERLRYSYGKLSHFVHEMDGKPLIKIGSRTLVFSENLGGPEILRFMAAVIADNGKAIDDELSAQASMALGQLGQGLLEVLRAVDLVQFNGELSSSLDVMFRFDQAFSQLFELAAISQEKHVNVDLFAVTWRRPPALISNLMDAAAKAWDQESREPLLAYFSANRAAWMELKQILLDWDTWMTVGIEDAGREALLSYLSQSVEAHRAQLAPPEQLTLDNLDGWSTRWFSFLGHEFKGALQSDQAKATPFIAPPRAMEGLELMTRTMEWSNRNFWPISDWVKLE